MEKSKARSVLKGFAKMGEKQKPLDSKEVARDRDRLRKILSGKSML